MSNGLRRSRLLALIAVAAWSLAACGDTKPAPMTTSSHTTEPLTGFAAEPASAILGSATRAMQRAIAYEATGRTAQNANLVNVRIAVAAPNRLAENVVNSVQTVELRVIGTAGFIKGNLDFWVANIHGGTFSEAQRLSGHWLTTSVTDTSKLVGSLAYFSSKQLASCLRETFVKPEVVGRETIDGQAAVVLRSAGGVAGSSPADLFVSTTAPHYPIAFQQTGPQRGGGSARCDAGPLSGDGQAVLRFSSWDQVVVTAPPHASPLA